MILRRFKYFMPERNEFSLAGEETLLSVSEYYGVKPRAEAFDDSSAESRAGSLEGYRIVKAGDFVMNYMLAWKGAYGVSDHDGIVSPAYAVYKINPIYADRRFIHHRLRSEHMRSVFRAKSKGIIESRLRLYPDAFLSMELELPDLSTQKTIADFLDRETARIDQLIEKKQRLLVVARERKANFILSAVTQGLNSEAQLSPSGLAWAPQLPSHWKPTRLRHLGQSIIGLTYSPDDLTSDGQGVPVLRANNIQAGRLISDGLVFVSKAVPDKLILREGDILICSRNGSRNLIGKNARASGEFLGMTFGAFNTVYRSKYSDFIYWVLQSPIFSYQAGAYLTSTINQLTVTTLGNLVVPMPPIQEQKAICSYIEERMPVFDGLLDKVQASLSKLQELRAALITAAVTGQIDLATWDKQGQTERRLDQILEAMRA